MSTQTTLTCEENSVQQDENPDAYYSASDEYQHDYPYLQENYEYDYYNTDNTGSEQEINFQEATTSNRIT